VEVKNMCCSEYRNSLHEYASGRLSELECHAIARHLKTCDKCRSEVEEIKGMKVFLKSGFQENLMPPMDLKSGIMASIDLKKYKKVYKNTLGELANWGMSLVAAGLILLFINVAPVDNIAQVQNGWDNTKENITEKINHPFSSLNQGFDKFTKRITELDGITGRIEREKEGGN
jgi:anti-sigma factor RsiW